MINRHAITRRADKDGVDAAVVERDYVLAHVVAQLHLLRLDDGGRLVFKGGTSLRLVHIGDYRYSADLDFTVINSSPAGATAAMRAVIAAARDYAGIPTLELTDEDAPSILYVGPLETTRPRRLKLDITHSEVVETVERRTLLPGLWPDLPVSLPFDVYSTSEIASEKLRCIIQRVQCRDFYDIFRLVEDLGVDLVEIRQLFERKVKAKGIDPGTFEDRFEDRLLRYKTRWDSEMSEHVASPPRFDEVVRIMRRHLRRAGWIDT